MKADKVYIVALLASLKKIIVSPRKILRDFTRLHILLVEETTLGANVNGNGPTFANQNEPTRIAVILVHHPTQNFI